MSEVNGREVGMAKGDQERFFYCTSCLVEFSIKVEPDKTLDEVRDGAPSSLEWLWEDEMSCPGCGTLLGEI